MNKIKYLSVLLIALMISCQKNVLTQGQLNGLRICSELSIGENKYNSIPVVVHTGGAQYSYNSFIINKDGTMGVVSQTQSPTNVINGYEQFNLEQMTFFNAQLAPAALDIYF